MMSLKYLCSGVSIWMKVDVLKFKHFCMTRENCRVDEDVEKLEENEDVLVSVLGVGLEEVGLVDFYQVRLLVQLELKVCYQSVST